MSVNREHDKKQSTLFIRYVLTDTKTVNVLTDLKTVICKLLFEN